MQKIITEGAGYQLASLAQLQDISAGITFLARKAAGDYQSPSQKRANKIIENLPEDMAKKAKTTGGAVGVTLSIRAEKKAAEEALKKQQSTEKAISYISGSGKGQLGAEFKSGGGDMTQEAFDAVIAELDNGKKSADAGQKELLQAYQDELIISKKEQTLTPKRFHELSEKYKKQSKEEQAKTQGVIDNASKSLTALQTIDESSSTIADLTAAALTGTEEGRLALKRAMDQKYEGTTVDSARMIKDFGETAFKAVEPILTKSAAGGSSYRFAKTKSGKQQQDILDVMSGGMVNVKTGDVVVDKNSLAQVLGGSPGSAIPMMKGNAAAGGAVPGAGNKIEITVNATEKDLGSRIANEIKGALYQLNVVGR